jgi:hypothetical protein
MLACPAADKYNMSTITYAPPKSPNKVAVPIPQAPFGCWGIVGGGTEWDERRSKCWPRNTVDAFGTVYLFSLPHRQATLEWKHVSVEGHADSEDLKVCPASCPRLRCNHVCFSTKLLQMNAWSLPRLNARLIASHCVNVMRTRHRVDATYTRSSFRVLTPSFSSQVDQTRSVGAKARLTVA